MGGPGPLEPEASGNRGQAGFTPNERRRFADIRKHADLIDPFRLLHGDEIVGKKVRYPPMQSQTETPAYVYLQQRWLKFMDCDSRKSLTLRGHFFRGEGRQEP